MPRNLAERAWLIFAVCVVPPVAADTATTVHRIGVTASVPSVPVETRIEQERSLHLPALRYTFSLELFCARPYLPQSASITVADTRVRLDAERILEPQGLTEVALRIPADQIAPLNANEFCRRTERDIERADDDVAQKNDLAESETAALPVAGVLSAYASLRCSDGQREEMVYVSQSLDVILECQTPHDDALLNSSAADLE